MKIQEQDLYHGAALTQIVEHKSFKALNKGSVNYGHYLINTDRHVFIKYRKGGESPWQYTLSSTEINAIKEAAQKGRFVYLCLVCGNVTICALNLSEIQQVIDLDANSQQAIRIIVPRGGSCRVSGSKDKLKRTIAHKLFPEKVFSQ